MKKIEELCQYCKNGDTKRITDLYDLKPYVQYYRGQDFKAFCCYCCDAHWSMETKSTKIVAKLKENVWLLSNVTGKEWSELFVKLKIDFFKDCQKGYIFSTVFGADFFYEVLRRMICKEEHAFLKPEKGNTLGEYDKNFNVWLELARKETA